VGESFIKKDGLRRGGPALKGTRGERTVLAVTGALLLLMLGFRLGTGQVYPVYETTLTDESVAEAETPFAGAEETDETEAEEADDETDEETVISTVDLNTAGLEELMTLPGIGEKRAQAILDWREENGAFAYPEDIILVPGIGEGIWEGLKEYVTAGG
jgi:competence ComEA-like helix-hairpin-helix protein